ncbi:MAG: LamG domain-containing protein [Phycisphaerae bacterium]|nr:LamG domain-containing protein [Phycisphaerae bacterium]
MGSTWIKSRFVAVAGTILAGLFFAAVPSAAAACTLLGDMNGDGVVNWRDIDPFVAAMNNTSAGHACPIDYWPLDGIARDYGCYENHGTLQGAPSFSADVPPDVNIGQSLSFDGVNDYVYLGTSLLNGGRFDQFTFQAWFKAGLQSDVHATIFANETTDGEFNVFIWGEGLEEPLLNCTVYIEGQDACSLWGPVVTDDQWHHVALRKNASEITLFLDGVAVDSCPAVGQLQVNGIWHAAVGCKYTNTPHGFFVGQIDEVKIHDRPLTDDEISAASSLIAYYPFDGDANDESGNGNDGTEHGGYSYVAGVCGLAISFDGTTGYADLHENTNLDGFDAFTVAVWINPATDLNADTGRQNFLYKGQPYMHAASYDLGYDDWNGALAFHLHSASNWFDESAVVHQAEFPANEWFHVVCTYDGLSLVQMYVNGAPVGTELGTGMNGSIFDISDPLTVGRRTDNNYYFEGALDELRIYDCELSPGAIQHLYETPCP